MSAPVESAAPAEVVPAAPHLEAACSPKICRVRYALDGRSVATTDGARALFIALDTGARTELVASSDERIVDVSATHRLVLLARGQALSFRNADGSPSALSGQLAGFSAVSLSEDGERAVLTKGDRTVECPSTWLELPSGKAHPIVLPAVAAGGSEQACPWVRRRAIQIAQSRIETAFADYTVARRDASDRDRGFYKLDNYAFVVSSSSEQGKLLGADIDAASRMVALARIPAAPEKINRTVILEIAPMSPAKWPARHWPLPEKFMALWLAPDGSRLLVRTREGDATPLSVWDTTNGKKLGTVDVAWEGFEFSPDAKHLAVASKGELRIVDLP